MGHGRDDGSPRRALGSAPRASRFANEPAGLTLTQHAVAFVKELSAVVIGAVIVASLLRGFVGQMFLIPSSSMENTLVRDDRVIVEKLSDVRRGEVIVFANPGGWLTGSVPPRRGAIGKAFQFVGVLPDTSTEHLIKRVVGLPGDQVVCCDAQGRVSVNGQPLDEASYLYRAPDGTLAAPSGIPFDVVVPSGHIFVLGDNRAHSRDSRCHLNDVQAGSVKGGNAFVAEDLVVGRGLAVVWPLGRTHRLPIPDTFGAVPAAGSPAPETAQIHAGPEANC